MGAFVSLTFVGKLAVVLLFAAGIHRMLAAITLLRKKRHTAGLATLFGGLASLLMCYCLIERAGLFILVAAGLAVASWMVERREEKRARSAAVAP